MKDNDKKIEQVATASLVPYAKNAKKHDAAQVAAIAGSIREFGFNNPVLIDGDNGIIAGHGRVLAAHQLGLDRVPCLRLTHLTDTQKRAYILADNRLAELGGGWDAEMLAAELEALSADGITMEEIGFDADALEELGAGLGDEGNPEADAEPQIDKAEELRAKWGVEPGQLWGLGDHRLLCGDSTKKEDVEKALGGASPLLMVTDPPYGVSYDASWRLEAGVNKPWQTRAEGKVENDDRADWKETWELFQGSVAYVWHGGLHAAQVAKNLEEAGFQIRSQIVWSKPSLVMGRGHYHWQHEPCWYAVRSGRTAEWGGDRKQSTIWNIANMHRTQGSVDDGKTFHSTQKPVECMARPIRNHDSEFVYEPFSGSGTTIIACEQLGRKCRAIEISPAYVAVALQRWADATGKTPKPVA
jgi:DNA modification methylase